ncbi:hypothetical protein RF11_07095 [Thelohanellus kitauei]|uniref:Uncharacterized protein n=1 Tax=Thelohanellus kitauei TaxID=669202 RepID=A0A0C2M575_THEKT|nr:hypothetical protein RF11_07095 [Thelohanellus kitauei]
MEYQSSEMEGPNAVVFQYSKMAMRKYKLSEDDIKKHDKQSIVGHISEVMRRDVDLILYRKRYLLCKINSLDNRENKESKLRILNYDSNNIRDEIKNLISIIQNLKNEESIINSKLYIKTNPENLD